jgi:AcrR family transcriptional regulator
MAPSVKMQARVSQASQTSGPQQSPGSPQPGVKRGRPQEADPRQIARVALRLFERRGYDRVTMDEVAEAAAVSRRTLFRLFPSKADLVWDGLKDIRDAVAAQAASLSGARLRLGVVVEELFVPVLRQLDESAAARLARRRLRLIARAPGLLNHPALREIEEVIATAVAASALPAGAPPSLVARTLVAATFASLLWWAEQGEELSALDVMRAALGVVALARDA